jgi:hypothetical protein
MLRRCCVGTRREHRRIARMLRCCRRKMGARRIAMKQLSLTRLAAEAVRWFDDLQRYAEDRRRWLPPMDAKEIN